MLICRKLSLILPHLNLKLPNLERKKTSSSKSRPSWELILRHSTIVMSFFKRKKMVLGF